MDKNEYRDVIGQAFQKRASLFQDTSTDCFRLFHADGDGISGLSVDIYGEYMLLQFFTPEAEEDSELIVAAVSRVQDVLPVAIKGIMVKNRLKVKNIVHISEMRKSELVVGDMPPADYMVRQLGIQVHVDLVNAQNTGIFLDMRTVRQKLLSYYPEIDSMLNLFCYSGVFSIHALLNGVKRAVNIDLSKSILQRAMNNYQLNGLPVDHRDFMAKPADLGMKYLQKKSSRFSLVVIDPPTFSRNKKKHFSLQRDFPSYLRNIEPLVKPGGYVLSAVNTYSISDTEYKKFHPKKWQLVFFEHESSDFPYRETPYLKVGLWKVD